MEQRVVQALAPSQGLQTEPIWQAAKTGLLWVGPSMPSLWGREGSQRPLKWLCAAHWLIKAPTSWRQGPVILEISTQDLRYVPRPS